MAGTDAGTLVTFNGASLTATLPAAPPSASWVVDIENTNATSLTISRNGLLIDGVAANISLTQNQGVRIFTDGTNYFTQRGMATGGGGVGAVNKQTTNYMAVLADAGTLISFNLSAAATLTLPASPPSATWAIFTECYGTASLAINPNGLTIDGSSSSITVKPGQGLVIFTDGTNYFTQRGLAVVGIRNVTLFQTVGTLTPGQIESGVWAIGKSFSVIAITVGTTARVRLYSTTALRDADVSRPATQPPIAGTQNGVIMDIVLTAGTGLSWVMSPAANGSDAAAPPTGSIGYNVTNLDTVNRQVQVTLTYLLEE